MVSLYLCRFYSFSHIFLLNCLGSLTSAMRNYLLSNTTDVFERSYQPVQIRNKLSQIAFGEHGKQDDALWSAISNAFLRRDPYAPLYITQKNMDEIELRNDITGFRQKLVVIREKHGLKSKDEGKIWGRIKWIYDCLEVQLLKRDRKNYFAEVDRLRAQGESTTHLHNLLATNPRRVLFQSSNTAAEKISSLLTHQTPPATLPDKIVAYLLGQTMEGHITEDLPKLLEIETSEKPRCLLGCGVFFNKASLTRHVKMQHTFKNPFYCPECRRLGYAESKIGANSYAWSSHVERVHGKIHTPDPLSKTIRRAYCLLCEDYFTPRGFTQHLNKKHLDDFSRPIQCPACPKSEPTKECSIIGRDSWVAHVREAHHSKEVPGALVVSNDIFLNKLAKDPAFNIKKKEKWPVTKQEEDYMPDAHPGKSVRIQCGQLDEDTDYLGDSDWKAESLDPHADEEFWVEGWD